MAQQGRMSAMDYIWQLEMRIEELEDINHQPGAQVRACSTQGREAEA